MNKSSLNKTLQQLEKDFPNQILPKEILLLVGKEKVLANKLLKDFVASDLRFMIQQGFGLQFLVPLAIEVLSKDSIIAAEYYEGDLLKTVLSVKEDFWDMNIELKHRIGEIAKWSLTKIKDKDEITLESFYQNVVPILREKKIIPTPK